MEVDSGGMIMQYFYCLPAVFLLLSLLVEAVTHVCLAPTKGLQEC